MGKIKVIKKSTLSGRAEADDYKIYPVTKTDAVFTDSEDKDECDTQTPQGANKTAKEIFNSIRKKGWVNKERIKDGAVTEDKLNNGSVTNSKLRNNVVTHDKLASNSINGFNIQDHSVTKNKLGGDALEQLNENTATFNDVVFHENENDSEVPIPTGDEIGKGILVDTEDFQVEDNKVQLADRDSTKGMGYKILRPRHIVENRPKVVFTCTSKAYYSGMLHVNFNGTQYHVELTENDDAPTVMSKVYAVLNPALINSYLISLHDNTITIIKRDKSTISECSVDNADTNADIHVDNTTEHIDIQFVSQDDFNADNTIYEVRYDVDLDNKKITIPANSVLKFNGGKFRTGTIVFSDTYILGPVILLFDSNLTLSGSYYSSNYDITNK